MRTKHLDEATFSACKIYWFYTRTTRDNPFGRHELYAGTVARNAQRALEIEAKPMDPNKGCPFTLTIAPRLSGLEIEFSCNDCSGPIANAEYFRDHKGDDVIVTFSTDVEKVWVHLEAA